MYICFHVEKQKDVRSASVAFGTSLTPKTCLEFDHLRLDFTYVTTLAASPRCSVDLQLPVHGLK